MKANCKKTISALSGGVRAARLLALVILLLTLPATALAQFNYAISNGTITIIGYTGPGGEVAIPSEIDGLAVTGIGDRAFFNHASITGATTPESVNRIGEAAFDLCSNL